MNHTIARQSIQFNKPDVVVNMNFDTYGAIPDYASMWRFQCITVDFTILRNKVAWAASIKYF